MKHRLNQLCLALCAAAAVTFAASAQAAPERDPLESYNRAMFSVNEGIDTVLLRPVAQGYRYVTPEYARKGLRNAFRNIYEPVNSVNALLQGDVDQFFVSFWRFMLNSTFGLAGVYDFAGEYANLSHRREDFGQTLAVWMGETDSTYVVLPLIGPSTVRDTVGFAVDMVTNPWFYVLEDEASIGALVAEVIVRRESALDLTDKIYDTSFDPYASFRSAYQQRRTAQIENRN